ncbi:MAG: hypothetical protein COU25_04045 [Candidatus Levybacteria bacterium CG10_big_fil_rev_8_21_14_0_10_35_13]|nr:MAG: hypothetical protein COU25_04045 [Candidatus Levybacteria bacterium CG10_big_fil_rev_8_21_14_0_10_35_13]
MKEIINKILTVRENFWFSWYFLILYYFILRAIFGIEYWLIYTFAIFMIIMRLEFERIVLIFFAISMITYVFSTPTEANHYMSFVFGFLVLSLLKHFYFVFKEKLKV